MGISEREKKLTFISYTPPIFLVPHEDPRETNVIVKPNPLVNEVRMDADGSYHYVVSYDISTCNYVTLCMDGFPIKTRHTLKPVENDPTKTCYIREERVMSLNDAAQWILPEVVNENVKHFKEILDGA